MNRIKLTLVDDSPVGTVDNFEIKDGAWPYGSLNCIQLNNRSVATEQELIIQPFDIHIKAKKLTGSKLEFTVTHPISTT